MPGVEGVGDVIQQPLYDTIEVNNATTVGYFFQRPIGQPMPISGTPKSEIDTNMTQAGNLPAGHFFDVMAVSLMALIPDPVNAVTELMSMLWRTVVKLNVGNKTFLTIPALKLSAGCGIHVFAAYDANAVAANTALAQNGEPSASNLYTLKYPIKLSPSENFNVEIRFGGTSTLSGTRFLTCYLEGILTRPVQ